TAPQPGVLILIWTWLKLPLTVPVVALSEVKFTCQGRPAAVTVAGRVPWPHSVPPPAVIEPMPVPGSPLPLVSVPLSRADGEVAPARVVVSFRVNVPDFRETGPPGRTVQVAAARAVLAPTVAARAAAQPATRMRA